MSERYPFQTDTPRVGQLKPAKSQQKRRPRVILQAPQLPAIANLEREIARDTLRATRTERPTAKECRDMPGETELHKTLKKEACRWMFRAGYRCIAAEVRLRPLGIIDAVGSGVFRPFTNYLCMPRELQQTCFIECKASRSDFLRDLSPDGQMQLCLMERERNRKSKSRRRKLHQSLGLGKFDSCLLQPMANIHYILAPTGIVQKKDVPPRWGLLTLGENGISVVTKPMWQEASQAAGFVESAIARTLTGDIYRADDRAISSVNRIIFAEQRNLSERIRLLKPVLAPEDIRKC